MIIGTSLPWSIEWGTLLLLLLLLRLVLVMRRKHGDGAALTLINPAL
jgi:hypothetical protein